MDIAKGKQKVNEYIEVEGLRHSKQREHVLEVLFSSGRHLTAEELYNLVKNKYPEIGQATVYRALKLFCQAGICRAVKLEEGPDRYETVVGHEHHDHLICLECGNFEEVISSRIEKLQEKLAEKNGYELKHHRLVLYGICPDCQK